MLARILKFRKTIQESETVREKAGRLFDSGLNCAQAVLQATTGIEDPRMIEMAKPFGGGIGGSKCLCGAVSGGVLALGWNGKGNRADKLVAAFKESHQFTCCVALSKGYKWKSREHLSNCRRITEETAGIVDRLLNE